MEAKISKLFLCGNYQQIINLTNKCQPCCDETWLHRASSLVMVAEHKFSKLDDPQDKYAGYLWESKRMFEDLMTRHTPQNAFYQTCISSYKYTCSIMLVHYEQLRAYQKVLDLFGNILKFAPDDVDSLFRLGVLYISLKQPSQALTYLEKGLECTQKPTFQQSQSKTTPSEVCRELLNVYRDAHNMPKWNELVKIGLGFDPSDIFILNDHALVLMSQNNFSYSEKVFEKAMVIARETHQMSMLCRIYLNYGTMFAIQGLIDRSIAEYENCLEVACPPDDKEHAHDKYKAFSNILLNLCYSYKGLQKIREKSVDILKYIVKIPSKTNSSRPKSQRYQHTKIRIGYVSGDLIDHACANFIHPILQYYDRSRYELYCFTTKAIKDGLWTYDAKLINISVMSIEAVCDQIRDLEIDLLIDLSGHTMGGNLEIFYYAPVAHTATYIGYPNTTGLKCIKYKIVDSVCHGEDDFIEQKLDMDSCSLCYDPMARLKTIPPTGPELVVNSTQRDCSSETMIITNPSVRKPILFGCFNKIEKITDECLELWGQLLNRVPDSKLVLKLRSQLDPKRCNFLDRIIYYPFACDYEGHLQIFQHIDVMLDTFPYSATTIACESLLMNKPVITLKGRYHIQNIASSIIYYTDPILYQRCVAHSKEEYIEKAIDMARNPISEVRQKFLGSVVTHPKEFMVHYEATLDRIREEPTVPPVTPLPREEPTVPPVIPLPR